MYKQSLLANIHKGKSVAYLTNQKVACTSLNNILTKNDFSPRKKVEIDFDDFNFIFTFVRNPWDRLISRYMHLTRRILETTEQGVALANSPQDRNIKAFFGKKPISVESFTFDKFVNFINVVDDPHWLPQTSKFNSCLDKIHFIGRFETLQQDFSHVCDKIGIPQQVLPDINKTKHKHYTQYYSNKTQKIVAEYYKEDIEKFKYKFGK